MSFASTSKISFPDAEKILFKLCKHYAIKVPVVFDSSHADITFAMGRCQIWREGDLLRMRCEADALHKLKDIQHIMDEHLALMTHDRALVICWHEVA
ncbi:MAG: DUF2218 domain-containing protein [Brachymonas sp.]|nr:DUF2218 domain-containing protein [Brachymonas sp.]